MLTKWLRSPTAAAVAALFASGEPGAVFIAQKPSDLLVRRNLLLATATLGTQSVALAPGGTYTLSGGGTGTVTLSGGATGVFTAPTTLTFVVNAGSSVTFTVAGSVTTAQLEKGSTASTYQPVTDWTTEYLAQVGNLVTQYTDNLGSTPALNLEDTVGLHLDTRPIVGKATGPNTVGQPLYAADTKATGVIGLIGAATAATYNTSTGVGAATRVAAANQSYVTWAGTALSFVRLTVNNTGASGLTIYTGTPAGTAITSVAAGVTKTFTLALGAATALSIAPTADGTSIAFTVSAYQVVYGNHRSQSSAPARARLSARYNKVTARNANPVDLTGVTKGGDAAATLAVVNDAAALAAAGLSSICTLGNVYKLDNSAGVGNATATFSGGTGNLAAQTFVVYTRGTVTTSVFTGSDTAWNTAVIGGASYSKVTGANKVPNSTGTTLKLTVTAGDVVYFILMDMRESCYSYLPTPQIITGTGSAATDYDDTGFPARLVCSGAQGYATGNIDFSGVAQAQIFHGITKLSDATLAAVAEFSVNSTTNFGTFAVFAPVSTLDADYGFNINGSTAQSVRVATTFTSPVVNVLSGQFDVTQATTAAQNVPRVNGATPTLSNPAASGVAAALGNYPINFFSRGNAGAGVGSAPFTGDEFISIVRGGATPTLDVIAPVERFCGAKMLVYL